MIRRAAKPPAKNMVSVVSQFVGRLGFNFANTVALAAVLVATFQSALLWSSRNDLARSQLFATRVTSCSATLFNSRKFAVRVSARHGAWIEATKAGQGGSVALDDTTYHAFEDLMGGLMTLKLVGPDGVADAAHKLQGAAINLIAVGTGEVSDEKVYQDLDRALLVAEKALTTECHEHLTVPERE